MTDRYCCRRLIVLLLVLMQPYGTCWILHAQTPTLPAGSEIPELPEAVREFHERQKAASENPFQGLHEDLKTVPFPEIPNQLRRMAEICRANFEKIKTWDAEFELQDVTRIELDAPWLNDATRQAWSKLLKPDSRIYRQDFADVVLHLNPARDVVCEFRITDSRYKDSTHQVDLPKPEGQPLFHQRSLITNDSYWSFSPNVTSVGPSELVSREADYPQSGSVAYRDAPGEALKQSWGVVIRPQGLFSRDGVTMIWDELFRLADALENDAFQQGVAKIFPGTPVDELFQLRESPGEKGYIYLAMKLASASNPDPAQAMRFELAFKKAAAYNLVGEGTWNAQEQSPYWTWWRFKEQDGVFVPVSRIHIKSDEQFHRFTRHLTSRKSIVNQPQDPKLFSLAGLGLENGDRVLDRVTAKAFVYRDGQLENEVPFKTFTEGPDAILMDRTLPFLAFLAIVTIALLGWGIIRGRRSRTRN